MYKTRLMHSMDASRARALKKLNGRKHGKPKAQDQRRSVDGPDQRLEPQKVSDNGPLVAVQLHRLAT